MRQQSATVLENRKISCDCYRLRLNCPEINQQARPGQFVMLRLPDQTAPLLPRPFSISALTPDKQGILLVYKVVGSVTARLADFTGGEVVSLVGPLGRGFSLDFPGSRVFLVAGGIGVAPLVFLAKALTTARPAGQPLSCRAFLGGASCDDLLCQEALVDCGLELALATEDGSAGSSGLVTDILAPAVQQAPPDAIFACGPNGLIKAVQALAGRHQIFCEISIEAVMSCGIGACLGCAVPSGRNPDEYLHVCKDGPVFQADAVRLP